MPRRAPGSISAWRCRPTARPARWPGCSRARAWHSGSWPPDSAFRDGIPGRRTGRRAGDQPRARLARARRARPRRRGLGDRPRRPRARPRRARRGRTGRERSRATSATSRSSARRSARGPAACTSRSPTARPTPASGSCRTRRSCATTRGVPLGIVRFELALASVRATAAAALGGERDVQVAVVDRASGRKILDTSRGVLAGGPGAQPAYRELDVRLARPGHDVGGRPAGSPIAR